MIYLKDSGVSTFLGCPKDDIFSVISPKEIQKVMSYVCDGKSTKTKIRSKWFSIRTRK